MKTTGKEEEICDESCDCHEENTVRVGDRVYTNTEGGAGLSDEMKKLIAMKDHKIKGGK